MQTHTVYNALQDMQTTPLNFVVICWKEIKFSTAFDGVHGLVHRLTLLHCLVLYLKLQVGICFIQEREGEVLLGQRLTVFQEKRKAR